jgi:hypothetical protein
MFAILSKKKDTIRVESVNTDAENIAPPGFLGINDKIYARPIPLEGSEKDFYMDDLGRSRSDISFNDDTKRFHIYINFYSKLKINLIIQRKCISLEDR